jgi:hypothetical protein
MAEVTTIGLDIAKHVFHAHASMGWICQDATTVMSCGAGQVMQRSIA